MSGFQRWIDGRPRPKGSMRPGRGGRMFEDNPHSAPWRQRIVFDLRTSLARSEHRGDFPLAGPVAVRAHFVFLRPKNADLDTRPCTTYTGDTDKLVRNVGDALKDAGIYRDDSQVVEWTATSWYGIREGVWLHVTTELAPVPFALAQIVGVAPGQ